MAEKEDKGLLDYKITVSFGMSKGHLDSIRSPLDDERTYQRRVQSHVKNELAKRLAGQILHVLEDTIEPIEAEYGNKEWVLEVVAVPYDALVNLLDAE